MKSKRGKISTEEEKNLQRKKSVSEFLKNVLLIYSCTYISTIKLDDSVKYSRHVTVAVDSGWH